MKFFEFKFLFIILFNVNLALGRGKSEKSEREGKRNQSYYLLMFSESVKKKYASYFLPGLMQIAILIKL